MSAAAKMAWQLAVGRKRQVETPVAACGAGAPVRLAACVSERPIADIFRPLGAHW